jgi:hypothetical protein
MMIRGTHLHLHLYYLPTYLSPHLHPPACKHIHTHSICMRTITTRESISGALSRGENVERRVRAPQICNLPNACIHHIHHMRRNGAVVVQWCNGAANTHRRSAKFRLAPKKKDMHADIVHILYIYLWALGIGHWALVIGRVCMCVVCSVRRSCSEAARCHPVGRSIGYTIYCIHIPFI